jgi:hypothetical protein
VFSQNGRSPPAGRSTHFARSPMDETIRDLQARGVQAAWSPRTRTSEPALPWTQGARSGCSTGRSFARARAPHRVCATAAESVPGDAPPVASLLSWVPSAAEGGRYRRQTRIGQSVPPPHVNIQSVMSRLSPLRLTQPRRGAKVRSGS